MRAVLVLIIALALGGAAFFFATRVMGAKAAPKAKPAIVKVVVAAADLPAGGGFKPEALKLVDWPAAKLPVGAFSNVAQLNGRVLKTSAANGAMILEPMLSPPGSIGGLSAMLAPGSRAMTIRVNDVVGVAGFPLPGNYVDVISYLKLPRKKDQTVDSFISKTVLEHILVLASAQRTGHEDTTPKTVESVTLQVTPQQAEMLDMVSNAGKLTLVLRNQMDDKAANTPGVSSALSLAPLSSSAPRAAKPRVSSKRCSRVIQGAQVSQECF
jgi:pilus assembly protein CpaB